VRALLERGANINTTDDRDQSVLHCAITDYTRLGVCRDYRARNRICMLLIEKGVHLDTKDVSEATPLHYIARHANVAFMPIMLYLLGNRCDVSARDIVFNTPLCSCISRGSLAMAGVLIDHGADVNEKYLLFHGQTPLLKAVHMSMPNTDHIYIVRLLIERGADETVRDCDARTPLEVSVYNGFDELTDVITTSLARRQREREARILALCMSQHERIGWDSFMYGMPGELIRRLGESDI
jgi:ankyrin repeat protein